MNEQMNLQDIQFRMQNAVIGTQEFSQALEQLNKLINQGNIEAGLYLSWVYTQRGGIIDTNKKAYELCERIVAATDHPAALERMADLLLWGVGLEKDEAKSFGIYKKLVDQGLMPFTTLAYLYSQGIGTIADECEASTLILKAAAQGDTLAFMLLSFRYEVGLGVPINGKLARAYATLAVKREFPGAQQRLDKLNLRFSSIASEQVDASVEILIKNIEHMYDKVAKLNQSVGPNNPEFAAKYMQLLSNNFSELNISDLSIIPEVRGFEIKQRAKHELDCKIISDSPLIMSIDCFASFEECQYLIQQAIPMLESTKQQAKKVTNTEIDAFSGDSAIFTSRQTSPVDRTIQQRFSEIENVPVSYFEPISLLKYSVGHDYSTHTDAFDAERIRRHELKGDFGGQRMTTNLIYLLPAIEGGITRYDKIDLNISGEMGMSVIHHNARADFNPDPQSLHTGMEILQGEKWLLRTATRQNPLYGTNKTVV